jgi:hypothetical protein
VRAARGGGTFMSLLSRRTVTRKPRSVQLNVEQLESKIVPAVLTVGVGKMYATLGAAAAAANSGDTVRVDPGTFSGAAAVAVWNDSNITIEGAGASRTVLDATGFNLPNRKGIFTITGHNVTVRNIEFVGAHDTAGLDRNWAGIRQEGDNVVIQNCYFRNNDMGVLGGGSSVSDVLIEYSEFARNGYGDGLAHNIYIGDVNSFTFRHSFTHDANVGHDLKSRARTNIIVGNWIGGTGVGSESYEINLPDGGTAYIIGNVIRQDPSSQNAVIVDWGSENNGGANPSQGFYFVNNTVINDRGSGGTGVRMLGGIYPTDVRLLNNIFAGASPNGVTYSGPTAQQLNNLVNANPGFVNAGARDYRLTSAATAAINQGADPGTANSVDLEPVWHYVPTAQREARVVWGSAIDLGAFEFGSAPPTNQPPTVATPAAASANPVIGTSTNLSVLGADDAGAAALTYTWSLTGTPPATVTFSANGTNAARNTTATFSKAGAYSFLVTIRDAGGLTTTSSVNVTVNQTLTSLAVTPGSVTLNNGGTQQFSAQARDQFGTVLAVQPAFTWALASGVGSVGTAGLYTAPATGTGSAVVRATSGAVGGTASVTVQAVNQSPTVATAAAASANPVTSVNLSALGADDGGAANLIYTWALIGTPPATVSFGANGTNAARNTSASFSKAGAYSFRVTIRDAGGLTTTSDVNVTVSQKLTSIAVTPGAVTLASSGAQQFVAQGRDQFGAALTVQPAFTWSLLTGSIGSVTTAGRYTAPATGSGAATVRAASGSISGSATVTVQATTTTQPFQQENTTNGLVVMEAESFHGRSTQNGKSWANYTATAGFSGTGALVTTPNSNVTNDVNYVTASPRLDFRVNFVKTGVHYVWVRGLGATANDDSLHVGLDGAAVASADKLGNLATTYGWTKNTLDGVVATINVTTIGIHTVNVWMREDGTVVDKLLLTTNASYTPTGTGPTQSPRSTPAVNGLTATYFDNRDFTGVSVSRIDSTVNYNWGSGSPAAGIAADTFSARWTGKLKPRYSQTYTFYTTSDDGVRLWINGQLIIDQWNDHSPTTHSGTIALQANQLYDIRLEYYENGGGAVMKLEWQSASQAREVVPLSQLFSK